jgi:hypothetical protein
MPNTTDGRRATRVEALSEVLRAVRGISCPAGHSKGWATEFQRGIGAISAVLHNQIAQAEGRVVPRCSDARRTPRKSR